MKSVGSLPRVSHLGKEMEHECFLEPNPKALLARGFDFGRSNLAGLVLITRDPSSSGWGDGHVDNNPTP